MIFINVKTCQLFQLFVSDLSESEASPFKHKCTNCSKKYKYRFIKGLIDDPECFKLIDQYIFPLIFYLYNEEAAYYDGSPILCCIELTFRHELCHCTFHWWCWTVSSLGCNNAILRQLEFSFRTKVNFSKTLSTLLKSQLSDPELHDVGVEERRVTMIIKFSSFQCSDMH